MVHTPGSVVFSERDKLLATPTGLWGPYVCNYVYKEMFF